MHNKGIRSNRTIGAYKGIGHKGIGHKGIGHISNNRAIGAGREGYK